MAPNGVHATASDAYGVAELTDLSRRTDADNIDGEGAKAPTVQEEERRPSEESSQSEILYAAGVGLIEDNPETPCLTLRMWVIGIGFCLLGSGVNTLYTFRIPSITLSQSAIQFLAYPIGKAWYLAVPEWEFSLLGLKVNTNPGPFNSKVSNSARFNRYFIMLTPTTGEHARLHHGQPEFPHPS